MYKLLYLEDNEDNLYMLTLRFDVLGGYEIVSAPDGAKGIALAAAERPDLILMDLNLPVIDGWEATRRLKDDPATRDIPIIALTAHAMAGDREKALAAGCDEFDTKPVEFDRLLAKIEQVLAARGGRVGLPQLSRPEGNARSATADDPGDVAGGGEVGRRRVESMAAEASFGEFDDVLVPIGDGAVDQAVRVFVIGLDVVADGHAAAVTGVEPASGLPRIA